MSAREIIVGLEKAAAAVSHESSALNFGKQFDGLTLHEFRTALSAHGITIEPGNVQPGSKPGTFYFMGQTDISIKPPFNDAGKIPNLGSLESGKISSISFEPKDNTFRLSNHDGIFGPRDRDSATEVKFQLRNEGWFLEGNGSLTPSYIKTSDSGIRKVFAPQSIYLDHQPGVLSEFRAVFPKETGVLFAGNKRENVTFLSALTNHAQGVQDARWDFRDPATNDLMVGTKKFTLE